MALTSNIKDRDWVSVRQAAAKLASTKLGPTSTPTFLGVTTTSLTISGLTTNALIYPVSGLLTSLGVAANGKIPIGSTGAAPVLAEITGTANQITSTPGAGSITLSTPQDIHTGAIPTFAGAILNGTTAIGLDMSGGTFATAIQNWPADPVIQAAGTQIFKNDATNFNVLIGDDAFQNDNGQYNVCLGFNAGYNNSTVGGGNNGKYNAYLGYNAGKGTAAGNKNQGNLNVYIGWKVGEDNSTGYNNMGLGANTFVSNTTGFRNVAIGASSCFNNENGQENVGIGYNSLFTNVGGGSNIALGSHCLFNNISSQNIGVGPYAAYENTGGAFNISIGSSALYWNQNGNRNVAIGYVSGGQSKGSVTTFHNSTFIGSESGRNNATANGVIFLGYKSGFRQTAIHDLLIIDNQDRGSAAAEITDCLMYGVFNATPASQTLRLNVGDFIQGNPTHSDADGGGAMVHSFIREDGAGTPTTAATLTVSHDGAGANDQLAKMVLGVNTGAGVVDALKLDSNGVTVPSLTVSLLTSTNGSKTLTSVSDLTAWIAGTTDHISVTDDTDGTVTLDLDTNTQTLLGSFNGIFLEKMDFTITEAGGTVTGTLEQADGGGDLTQKFSNGYSILDCTPAKTIDLTAYVGTNAVPKEVFVYILQSAPTVIVATNTDWPLDPEVEHIKIAHLVLKSATTTGTDGGALMNQNHNDYAFDATGEGHLQDIEHRLRQEPAQYHSGVALTLKNAAGAELTTTNSSTAVELVTATGHVFQIHQHNFPAFDMYTEATDKADIVNQPTDEGGGYDTTVDLVTDVTHYVDGTAAGVAIGVNKYFNLVVWGVMNKDGEESFLMINLPTSQYTTSGNAVADVDGTSVFEIPSAFKGVGFLIARLTFRLVGGSQWTYIAQEDLRGKFPDIIAGVGITTTDHALLANLTAPADDHTQYLLADGTRALAGAWDLGSQDLTNGGVLFLTEQAAAEAHVAGKGQFWVKTATPNEPWFDNDAGTETPLDNRTVDRGDPVNVDWSGAANPQGGNDFLSDGNYHDLDLTDAGVPAGVISVLLRVTIRSATVGSSIQIRKNGNTNTRNRSTLAVATASGFITMDATVFPDSNGVVEYAMTDVVWLSANITVGGWTLS